MAEGFRTATARAADLDAGEIALRGFADIDGLENARRYVFIAILMNVFRVGEEAFVLHEEGRSNDRYGWGFKRHFSSITSLACKNSFQILRRHDFHSDFQEFIDLLEPVEWRIDVSLGR